GSMRDGLSLLDQALAFGAGEVREQDVRDMLGSISRDRILAIVRALFSGDAAAVLGEVDRLGELTPDFENVLTELLSLLHHMALAKSVPEVLDEYVSARDELIALSAEASAEDIQLFYQIGLIGRRDLPLAPDLRSGFEMVLLRMLAFRPAQAPNLVGSATGTAQSATPQSAAPQLTTATPAPAVKTPAARQKPQATEVAPQKTPAADRVAERPATPRVDGDWAQIMQQLAISGMVKQLAANCVLQKREANTIVLALDSRYKQLRNPKAEKRIQSALSEYYDAEINLQIELADQQALPVETPAQTGARERDERQQQAENTIENDGFVQMMKKTMNAEIIPGSVKPVESDT
ncbi:MAG: DNA polymerase III subunit gamma/tau C-terminal domain-containing protein, partial [Gammaproteobacteria bacterium]